MAVLGRIARDICSRAASEGGLIGCFFVVRGADEGDALLARNVTLGPHVFVRDCRDYQTLDYQNSDDDGTLEVALDERELDPRAQEYVVLKTADVFSALLSPGRLRVSSAVIPFDATISADPPAVRMEPVYAGEARALERLVRHIDRQDAMERGSIIRGLRGDDARVAVILSGPELDMAASRECTVYFPNSCDVCVHVREDNALLFGVLVTADV